MSLIFLAIFGVQCHASQTSRSPPRLHPPPTFPLLNYWTIIPKSKSEPIENWEAIVHKGVRTNDRLELGNVVEEEVDNEKFIAIQGVIKEKEECTV